MSKVFSRQFVTSDIPDFLRYIRSFGLIVLASALMTAAGIALAVYEKYPADGGRGGALATCISFFALFVRPDRGLRIYHEIMKEVKEKNPNPSQVEALEEQANAIVQALRVNSNGLTNQNWAVAVAAIIGTLGWGFGDVVACRILNHRWHCS